MNNIHFRCPTIEDGATLHELVKRCPPLDENSRYCNLLQVTHFADTSVVAERDGQLCGFITGYRVPGREHVLFVWQVGVSPEGRGQGLARQMLMTLIERLRPAGVSHLETTVTPDNTASQALFEGVALAVNAPLERSVLFAGQSHFGGGHDDEVLHRIGPFSATDERSIDVQRQPDLQPDREDTGT